MAKFLYRMQNVLNVKEKMEEQAKMEYGFARIRLTEEEEKRDALIARRAFYEEEARKALVEKLDVQKMAENKEAILRMDEFILIQEAAVAEAEKKLELCRQHLQESMQERKIQEKLKENAFEEFLEEEKAKESKEIDELTSYIYGQRIEKDTG